MSRLTHMIDMGKYWCQYSTHPQHRMSALAYDSTGIIAGGANSLKTHPKAKTYGNHLHAELALIFTCFHNDLKGMTVIVTRVKKSGALGTSKPCEVCWAALKEKKVKYVIYYSEAESKWVKEKL